MTLVYAIAVGAIAGAGIYMMLDRHVVRTILGIALLAAAANLLIFVSGRIGDRLPPVISRGQDVLPDIAANPLPQALVLTAIVIGFALIAFSIVLVAKAHTAMGTTDNHEMTAAEDEGSPFTPVPALDKSAASTHHASTEAARG